MFGRKATSGTRKPEKTYDKENQEPVLRCSICTGEKTAGFRDLKSGKFTEVTLIRTDEELLGFMEEYGLETIRKIY